ncbi:unnamed protein product [Rotaria magnacalcarata]|uniref:G-protein coupled receptors family 1 profile domain-containing protein n=1 Tax=Rotaria magnacalcarata TaxID=392030 RepID=A0A815SWN2_9BILA|nr:unnamed protein product [Rotaria magnacalcarata]CAF2025846.1 unnamed protein product [Rotaria magnacalcarata]
MFLTFVKLDRACSLRSRWCKVKIAQPRVAFTISAIILVISCINGFLFGIGFDYSVYNNSTGMTETVAACYYSLNVELSNFFNIQYGWMHLVVMHFLPCTIMITCTLFTM